jgi:hypothetical protein
MPDPLPILTQAFDAAYVACAREVATLPPWHQSNEIMYHVARFCRAQHGRDCDHPGERKIIEALGNAAVDPASLTALIAEINAEAGDDDFPAARLDPRNRHGWARARAGELPRIIARPPWQQPTDDLLAQLRRYTEGLHGERLHAQFATNIENRAGGNFIVPEQPHADHHMMPVTLTAYYLQCFEQRIRDLETALEERGEP